MSQAPLGALVDAVRAKRALIAGAVVMVTATCLVIPLAPRFWTVAAAGLVGALAGVTIGPTLAAISLGVVGPARFARRAGRNEALFHLGDGSISLVILLAAPFLGNSVLFWTMGFTAVASVAAAAAVPARRDKPRRRPGPAARRRGARGAALSLGRAAGLPAPAGVRGLRRRVPPRQRLHAGAGLAEARASERSARASRLTAASAIAAQSVMVPVAALVGARADAWGRKPLLLAAFVALALRGVLYTLSDNTAWLIGVQLLDGVGAGLMGRCSRSWSPT